LSHREAQHGAARLKDAVAGLGPLTVLYRCNAGPLPADHWIADPAEGGRILGEARHFVDFFAYLTDSMPRAGVFGSETCFAPTKGTIRSCPPSWPRCVPKAKCPSTPIRFA